MSRFSSSKRAERTRNLTDDRSLASPGGEIPDAKYHHSATQRVRYHIRWIITVCRYMHKIEVDITSTPIHVLQRHFMVRHTRTQEQLLI